MAPKRGGAQPHKQEQRSHLQQQRQPQQQRQLKQQPNGHPHQGVSSPKAAAATRRDLSPLVDALLSQLNPPRVREYIPRDGSCLFRCVASGALGSALWGQRCREACVKYMVAHADDFAPFLLESVPFDHYVYDMARPKTWGGNLEIQAMSIVYSVNFRIWSLAGEDSPAPHLVETLVDNGFGRTLELVLFGNHYDSLHSERSFDLYKFVQSAVFDIIDASLDRVADRKMVGLEQARDTAESVVFWSDDQKHAFKPISWERWLEKRHAQNQQDAAIAQTTSNEFELLTGYYRKHQADQRLPGGQHRARKFKDVLVLTGNVGPDLPAKKELTKQVAASFDISDTFDFPSLPPDVGERGTRAALALSRVKSPTAQVDAANSQLSSIFRKVRGADATMDAARLAAHQETISLPGNEEATTSEQSHDANEAPKEQTPKPDKSSAEVAKSEVASLPNTQASPPSESSPLRSPKTSAWGKRLPLEPKVPLAPPGVPHAPAESVRTQGSRQVAAKILSSSSRSASSSTRPKTGSGRGRTKIVNTGTDSKQASKSQALRSVSPARDSTTTAAAAAATVADPTFVLLQPGKPVQGAWGRPLQPKSLQPKASQPDVSQQITTRSQLLQSQPLQPRSVEEKVLQAGSAQPPPQASSVHSRADRGEQVSPRTTSPSETSARQTFPVSDRQPRDNGRTGVQPSEVERSSKDVHAEATPVAEFPSALSDTSVPWIPSHQLPDFPAASAVPYMPPPGFYPNYWHPQLTPPPPRQQQQQQQQQEQMYMQHMINMHAFYNAAHPAVGQPSPPPSSDSGN